MNIRVLSYDDECRKRLPGGNIRVISDVTENAARISRGQLSLDLIKEIHALRWWQYPYEGTFQETKAYIDSFDIVWLGIIFSTKEKLFLKLCLLEEAKRMGISEHPHLLRDFAEIMLKINALYNGKIPDSLSRWYISNISKVGVEEYVRFLHAYIEVLPAFERHDYYKIDTMLKEVFRESVWKKYFLWIKLAGMQNVNVLTWYYSWEESAKDIFESLTEEDIEYIAPLWWRSPDKLLTTFSRTKKRFADKNTALWNALWPLIEWNMAKEFLIEELYNIFSNDYYKDSTVDDLLTSKKLEDIRFVSGFWKHMKGSFGHSNHFVMNAMRRLRDILAHDKILLSEILNILAETSANDLDDYIRIIVTFLSKPRAISPQTIEKYISDTELLCKKYNAIFPTTIFRYFMRFGHKRWAKEALTNFMDQHVPYATMNCIDNIPETYEKYWDKNPIYNRAVEAHYSNPNDPKDHLGDQSSFFIQLVRWGLSIVWAEALYTKISESKDLYLSISNLKRYGLWSPSDFSALAWVIRQRPKKPLKTLAPTASIFQEYGTRKTLSSFLKYMPWTAMGSRELDELRSYGRRWYGARIRKLTGMLGKDFWAYEKYIAGFRKALTHYPNIGKNIDKFSDFEEVIFRLEIECMEERVCMHYRKLLGLSIKALPRELLEDAHMMSLVTIVGNTMRNKEIGREILREVLRYRNTEKPPSFALSKRENKEWCDKNLTEEQRALWKEENEKTYVVTAEFRKTDETLQREIEKFLSVAQDLLRDAWFQKELDCTTHRAFLKDISQFLEKNWIPEKLKRDLELQAHSIQRILKRGESRSIPSVSICHEQNTRNIMMMGDWVDGSCLASYSSVRNGYSTIANASEINKGILYAKDTTWSIIGRVLIAIDSEKKLVVFPVYNKWSPDVDLEKVFRVYIEEFAQNMNLEIGWDPEKVEKILGCEWYVDPVWDMKEEEKEKV
jgi:hypothetical protein